MPCSQDVAWHLWSADEGAVRWGRAVAALAAETFYLSAVRRGSRSLIAVREEAGLVSVHDRCKAVYAGVQPWGYVEQSTVEALRLGPIAWPHAAQRPTRTK